MLSNLTQYFRRAPTTVSFPPVELEPATDPLTVMDEPLFRGTRVAPQLRPNYEQPRSNLAGFFSALREAAERLSMTHIAPLAALDPSVRYQLRTIAVYVRPENDVLLHELQALSPHIIKTAAANCLKQSRVAEQFDLTEFFGIIIVAGEEVASGEAVITLATVGVERINIEFEFDGEHVSIGDSPEAADAAVPVMDIAFRLVHVDGRVEPLAASAFPIVIGKSSTAGICVTGTYVSREHATLYVDPVLRRVVLQDHSRHGTWLDGRRLNTEGRAILRGSGQIRLSSPLDSDAPVIEYSHSALDAQGETPLTPMAGEGISSSPMSQGGLEEVSKAATTSSPTLAAVPPTPTFVAEPLPVTQPQPAMPETQLSSPLPAMRGAQETELCGIAAPSALAWLQVRTQEGVKTVPVTELPFVIGREPGGVGYAVNGQAAYVSRQHLRLLSFHHKCFTIENGGLGRNNTYRKGVLQDNRFLYQPVPPTGDAGWMTLGGHKLDDKCVEVRLLNAQPWSVE